MALGNDLPETLSRPFMDTTSERILVDLETCSSTTPLSCLPVAQTLRPKCSSSEGNPPRTARIMSC